MKWPVRALCLMAAAALGWTAAPPPEADTGEGKAPCEEPLVPICESGLFYAEVPADFDGPLPRTRLDAARMRERFGREGVVRCRLVDFVDLPASPERITHDGSARVVSIGGEDYLVTGHTSRVSWFTVHMKTAPRAGRPHLLVAQLPNDAERETTFSLTWDYGSPFAPPFRGEEDYRVACQQENPFNPDVGVGVYTGREIPLDGQPYLFSFLFYPKSRDVRVTVSHFQCTKEATEASGAAVARIWMFDVLTPLREAPAQVARPLENERLVGMYQTHPWFFYAHYGWPARTAAQRSASVHTLVEHLSFVGFNYLEYNAVNGSDVANMAWFPSRHWPNLEGDLFTDLLPACAQAGIKVVPSLASLPLPPGLDAGTLRAEPDERGFCLESLQWHKDATVGRGLWRDAPDPLRPEVRRWLLECLRELLDHCADSPALFGVGFRVNGSIGLCYLGPEYGYSRWDIAEFRRDSGLPVPDEGAYEWLRANAWEEWIDWRCRRTTELWLAARDLVRSYRDDLSLVVKCVLPAEQPGPNVRWPEGADPIALMREHGYDPGLLAEEEGIVVEGAHLVSSDRFWFSQGVPNPDALRQFYFDRRILRAFLTREGRATEFYFGYWEESPHPDNEYGASLRTATTGPWGRFFFEAPMHHLTLGNNRILTLFGWERPTLAREAQLRAFCRGVRALPLAEPRPLTGSVSGLPEGARAAWYGERLAVLNNSPQEARVRITEPALAGRTVYDHASATTLRADEEGGVSLRVPAFGLAVLEAD